jgi:hypothetical protein
MNYLYLRKQIQLISMLFMNPVIFSKNTTFNFWKIQNETLKNCEKSVETLIYKDLLN